MCFKMIRPRERMCACITKERKGQKLLDKRVLSLLVVAYQNDKSVATQGDSVQPIAWLLALFRQKLQYD
jgi:hypothetical protein